MSSEPIKVIPMTPLNREFRFLFYAILGVIVPFGMLLYFFPGSTEFYWAWVVPHPRSAILIGAAYVGAIAYYALALKENDWSQTQNGMGGLIIFCTVLLIATMAHWDQFRMYYATTLVWLIFYYVGPFMVPIAYRKQNASIKSPLTSSGAELSKPWHGWLVIRGFLYLALAMFWLAQAETIAQIWPWPMTPLELRVFSGQPAIIGWNAVVILNSRFFWKNVRLGLVLSGAIGLGQLVGLFLSSTPYTMSGMGIVLPLMFTEWIVTPLLLFMNYEWKKLPASKPANTPPLSVVHTGSFIQFGTKLIGATYTAFGVIGFLPIHFLNPIHHEGVGARYLFNLVAINTAHNLIHLAIGITGLLATRKLSSARLWGRICGPTLLLVFVGGIVQAYLEHLPPDQLFLGLVSLNSPGHILHLVTGSIALYIGLVSSNDESNHADI